MHRLQPIKIQVLLIETLVALLSVVSLPKGKEFCQLENQATPQLRLIYSK